VLVRAKDRALRCCSEPSMAVARWWPAVVFWARGTGMEAPARGVEGGGSSGATRGEASRQEVAPGRSWSGGGWALTIGGRGGSRAEQRRQRKKKRGGGPRDLFAKIGKSRDSNVK
jgi:hypothetical protein